MTLTTPVVLASASPRRKELIRLAFQNVTFCPSQEEEIVPEGIFAEQIPVVLARAKAMSVSQTYPDVPVIGCDTVVISRGRLLHKPKDAEEAFRMLRELSGHKHTVCTGCAIRHQGREHSFFETTEVTFHNLSDDLIEAYIHTGEPMDKAGAYGIQGFGSLLVKEIRGDYFNVVGLPVSRLYREFLEFVK